MFSGKECLFGFRPPPPPLTLLFTSEGISLRLNSAKRYQKPFRGSHQGTTLTQCSQDRITLLAHLILLGTLPKGWLPQLVTKARWSIREIFRDMKTVFRNFFLVFVAKLTSKDGDDDGVPGSWPTLLTYITQHNSSTISKSFAPVTKARWSTEIFRDMRTNFFS